MKGKEGEGKSNSKGKITLKSLAKSVRYPELRKIWTFPGGAPRAKPTTTENPLLTPSPVIFLTEYYSSTKCGGVFRPKIPSPLGVKFGAPAATQVASQGLPPAPERAGPYLLRELKVPPNTGSPV